MSFKRLPHLPRPDTTSPSRRSCLRALALTPVAAALAACGGGGDEATAETAQDTAETRATALARRRTTTTTSATATTTATRTWRLGFGGMPPRFDVATLVQGIDLWSRRAELAVIHEETPWTELLAGVDPLLLVERNQLGLVNYYRSKGLKLLFVAELNDGIARESEAPQLRAAGRSLTEPAVQLLWRRYVHAVATLLQPDWLCLASETNLVRIAAPAALYAAVVRCANDAAADLAVAGLPKLPVLLTSVQVETAWGRLPGLDGQFLGIATDLVDFAFSRCLGLSSYPYLAHAQPEDMPDDWYLRLTGAAGLPAMVVECAWSSTGVGGRTSSEDLQRRYVERHARLLDGIAALGVVQLVFADLDPVVLPTQMAENLPLFLRIGLTDCNFKPKAALAAWDALYARRLK